MEDRLKRIENDIAALHRDMKAANETNAEVKKSVTALDGKVTPLKAEFCRDMAAMETSLLKWIFGTMIASMGTAVACAGLAEAIGKMIFVNKVP
jgi:hypothetical protein